jgi:hypothetical protein
LFLIDINCNAILREMSNALKERHAKIANKSLLVHPRDIRYSNLSQCLGLSGLGEIYLEAARVLCNKEWHDRAKQIANTLIHLQLDTNGGYCSLVEDQFLPTADLMVGFGGVAHFFLKLLFPTKIGFPLLLDPPSFKTTSSILK